MDFNKLLHNASFLLLCISLNLGAAEYVPDVYQDDYIVVRSGIAEAGKKPVNLGDKLSLIIEAEFPANEVIIENLDEQLFERSWGSEKGISLIDVPEVSSVDLSDGKTLIRSIFNFQFLDCPGDLASCRGNKIFELPVFTVGYQIIDNGGNVVNNKSIRFNTVPSNIAVMQALDIRGEGGLEELSAYLGNSGYPAAMSIPDDETASMWPVLAGGLIFLGSFFPVLLTSNSPRRQDTRHRSNTRWEAALNHLSNADENISDEEFSDVLRRSATWYSLDELGANPYDGITEQNNLKHNKEFREYFIDVLNQERIGQDKRQDYLKRFTSIISAAGYQGSQES